MPIITCYLRFNVGQCLSLLVTHGFMLGNDYHCLLLMFWHLAIPVIAWDYSQSSADTWTIYQSHSNLNRKCFSPLLGFEPQTFRVPSRWLTNKQTFWCLAMPIIACYLHFDVWQCLSLLATYVLTFGCWKTFLEIDVKFELSQIIRAKDVRLISFNWSEKLKSKNLKQNFNVKFSVFWGAA